MMKTNRHQFSRRFSLQPSTLKEEEEGSNKNGRHERISDNGGKQVERSAHYKIVVMGGAKVGKSAIINQFLYNTFTSKYKRTVEQMHQGDFHVSGTQLTLHILDTSGSFEFPAMRELSIKSADGFILVYDVNDPCTFEDVETLRSQILSSRGKDNLPIVVVGNKTDITTNQTDSTRIQNLVTTEWENGFVEVSAKDNLNITQVFKELLLQAKVKYNLSPALRRRRQSLPPPLAMHLNSRTSHAAIPSAAQLQHLEQIRERSDSKRNSCILS